MGRGPQVHTFDTSLLQVFFHDYLDTKFLTKVAMGRRPHIHIFFFPLLYSCSIVRTFFWIYTLHISSHKQTRGEEICISMYVRIQNIHTYIHTYIPFVGRSRREARRCWDMQPRTSEETCEEIYSLHIFFCRQTHYTSGDSGGYKRLCCSIFYLSISFICLFHRSLS